MKKTLFTAIIAFATVIVSIAQSNTQALIPYPNSIEQGVDGKTFTINDKTVICSTLNGDPFVIGELQRILNKRLGTTPAFSNTKQNKR